MVSCVNQHIRRPVSHPLLPKTCAQVRHGKKKKKNGPELGQDGVNLVEGRVDLLANLCTRQDDLARDEDEQDNLGLDHPVNQPGEQLYHHPETPSLSVPDR